MLASELRARAQKLEAEQAERIKREQQKLERKRKEEERAQQRAKELEEEKRAQRLALLAAEQQALDAVEAAREANHGVYLSLDLQAVPADEEAVRSRGIRRAHDKVVLPASVGNDLMRQDAPRNGPMLFELSLPSTSGAHTHAGVLEFSGPEGVVAVPRKVADCLWGRGSAGPSGKVRVTYRRLEKGTFVKFQPESRAFHDAVGGDDVRSVLEGALRACCTLTEGDWLAVAAQDGQTHYLKVVELQPQPQVSVIDTDIEAEVIASMETHERIREVEEAAAREQERLRQLRVEREQEAARAQEAATAAAVRAAERAAEEATRKERVRLAKQASLPPEPEDSDADAQAKGVLHALFRLPDGSRAQRRFTLDQPVQLLFDFVDAQGAGGWWPDRYQLVLQFPRRVLLPASAATARATTSPAPSTLAEAGLTAGQQAFLLEPLALGAEGDQHSQPA